MGSNKSNLELFLDRDSHRNISFQMQEQKPTALEPVRDLGKLLLKLGNFGLS